MSWVTDRPTISKGKRQTSNMRGRRQAYDIKGERQPSNMRDRRQAYDIKGERQLSNMRCGR